MKNLIRVFASVLLLAATLTACGLGAENPTAVPVEPGASPAVLLPTTQPGDPCANEYFAVKDNATYTYSSTGSPSGPYAFTRTITNVRADGFTISTQVKGKTYTQEWACKPEGLAAVQLGATDAPSMLAFEKFTDLQGSNISGVILPPSLIPGAEWNYALDIQGLEKAKDGNPATMTGHVTITYIAGNKESVTVPAGAFDAIAIVTNTVIDFNVAAAKLSIDSAYTVWYAPGVGWVKSSGNGKLGGQDYFETIVLESYNIP